MSDSRSTICSHFPPGATGRSFGNIRGDQSTNSSQQVVGCKEEESASMMPAPVLVIKTDYEVFGSPALRCIPAEGGPPAPFLKLESSLSADLLQILPDCHTGPAKLPPVAVPTCEGVPGASPSRQQNRNNHHSDQQIKINEGGGAQWDDVVRRIGIVHEASNNSLDVGLSDLSSHSITLQGSANSELQSLIASPKFGNSTLGSDETPFDFVQHGGTCGGGGGNLDSGGLMNMDLSDVHHLFCDIENEGFPGGTQGSHHADAGAGGKLEKLGEALVTAKLEPRGMLPMERIIIEPSRKVGIFFFYVHRRFLYHTDE